MSEEARVREIIEGAARGADISNKLVYDKDTRSFRPSSYGDDPDHTIRITNQDRHLWHSKEVA